MAKYGLAGRALRSPLNPIWTVGQGVRGLAGAANAAMPAVAEFGDKMVDEAAPEISKAGGELAKGLLPNNPGLQALVSRLAPDAAKLAGRAAYMGGVGAANNLADTMTLENTTRKSIGDMANAAAMSMPQPKDPEEKGPGSALRSQIDEDSARIKAKLAAGWDPAGTDKPAEKAAEKPADAPAPNGPAEEEVPLTKLKGATVSGGRFGQGNAVRMPATSIDLGGGAPSTMQTAMAGAAPAISDHLKNIRDNLYPRYQDAEDWKNVGYGMMGVGAGALAAGLGGKAAWDIGKKAIGAAPLLAKPAMQTAKPTGPASSPGPMGLPGAGRPELPILRPPGPAVGGAGRMGAVGLPAAAPAGGMPVTLSPQTVAGPLTPGQLQRLQDVINSNPRLMQLVQLKGGRVDPALRKLIESQVRDDPLTLVRQALRNAGERPM